MLSIKGKLRALVYLLLLVYLILITPSCKILNKTNRSSSKPKDTAAPISEASFYNEYSAVLKVQLKGTEDKRLIKSLSEWLGTPYKYAGNSKQGTDCSGMTQSVFLEVYGISLFRSSFDQLKNVEMIDKKRLEAGDLVFFITSGNKVSHVGIYIADNKFIHASTQRGVVINDLDETYYKERFHSAGRVKRQ